MTEPGQPTAKSGASTLIVRIVLLLILVVLIGALGYEYLVPRAQSAAAMENLDKLADEKTKAGEDATDEDVHKLIGFKPERENPNDSTLLERYVWASVVPGRRHELWCIYRKKDETWVLEERLINKKPEIPPEGQADDEEMVDMEGMDDPFAEGMEGLEGDAGPDGAPGGGEGRRGRGGRRGGGRGRGGRGGRGGGNEPVADGEAPGVPVANADATSDDPTTGSDARSGNADTPPAASGEKPDSPEANTTSPKPDADAPATDSPEATAGDAKNPSPEDGK